MLVMDMIQGKMAITQSGELAFDYSGYFYRFSADVHIPTKQMAVHVSSINKHKRNDIATYINSENSSNSKSNDNNNTNDSVNIIDISDVSRRKISTSSIDRNEIEDNNEIRSDNNFENNLNHDISHEEIISTSKYDTVSVRVQAFLVFYTRFQSADDDAIELKLAAGLGTYGKMRNISLSIDTLSVELTDYRNPNVKNIVVCDVFCGLRKFKVGVIIMH
jgi:hypothetical protein